jgi:uncharacterized protein with von Willebrand factor type A (vWA) domain
MACLLTAGVSLPCRTVGGVASTGVFIGTWQTPGSSAMTIGLTANGSISSFTGATVSFFQIAQDIEVGSLTTKSTVSIENGTAYDEITLTFTIFNFSQATQNIINSIKNGRSRAIIVGNDGNKYFVGYSNPVTLTETAGGIGKAMGDLNGVTFTLVAKEPLGILQVSDAAFAQVAVYA